MRRSSSGAIKFSAKKVYNSTVNDVLTRHCKACGISEISVHGLRHTHASLLLFAGVSIASVARRLGHASMTTTQKTYLHIIQELENKDVDLVMRTLSTITSFAPTSISRSWESFSFSPLIKSAVYFIPISRKG